MPLGNLNYDHPIRVAEGIYWVGVHDPEEKLHCNAYLVVDGEQAMVIDSGSRPSFAGVMMKILEVGVHPDQITGLIYQHYDPDLCGSIPNFLDLCGNPGLRIYSYGSNNIFLRHYVERSRHSLLVDLESVGERLTLQTRSLQTVPTPYTHAAGSFVTFDDLTRTLFTGDLFGSYSSQWHLFLDLNEECFACGDYRNCPRHAEYCPIPEFLEFHRRVMPCNKALHRAVDIVKGLAAEILAPQHGSVIRRTKDLAFCLAQLGHLQDVGVDGLK